MILAIFDLQVTQMLPTKFRVNCKSPKCFLPSFESTGLSVQEKKRKIDFQDASCHGTHPGFTIGTILAIFDLQVTPMLPNTILAIFDLQVTPSFLTSLEAFRFRRRSEK